MKKFVAAILASMMVMSLAGCGKTGIAGASDWVSEDDSIEAYKLEDGTYYYEGRLGSTMKTAWFDFVIEEAYVTHDEIGGYSANGGNELVVVKITVKNTFSSSIPMSNYDFQLQWNGGDNEFAWPVEEEDIIDDQFPAEYTLGVNESLTGYYVYEAPGGETDLNISFVEYYEDNTEGNAFWIYFTADEK